MNRIMKLLSHLIRWLLGKESDAYRTKTVESLAPRRLDAKTIYLVGEDGYLEYVTMICPCGCGDAVHLNLLPDERPVWRIQSRPNQPITLFPSIWRTVGCRSHYWVRDGRIEWCQQEQSLGRTA